MAGLAFRVWISRVTNSITEEIEAEDGDDNSDDGHEEPRIICDNLQVEAFLKHDSPTYNWGAQAKSEKTQSGFTENHSWDTQGEGDNDVAGKARHEMSKENASMAGPEEACGYSIIFFAQGEYFPTDNARGPKAATLQRLVASTDSQDSVLMVGDAWADLEAAEAAGTLFYPIEPSAEGASWKYLREQILPSYLAGLVPSAALAKRRARFAERLKAL